MRSRPSLPIWAAVSAILATAACQPVEIPVDEASASPASSQQPQAATGEVTVEYLASPEQQALDLPFSEAVRVGHMLYLSGQIGTLPGTMTLVEGGVQAETRQIMENIRDVLERNGSSLERVVKCTVMVADISEWPDVNEVYVEFFPGPKPARSALGANGLALGARIEIECWATLE